MSELEIGDKVQTGKEFGLSSLLMTLLIFDDYFLLFWEKESDHEPSCLFPMAIVYPYIDELRILSEFSCIHLLYPVLSLTLACTTSYIHSSAYYYLNKQMHNGLIQFTKLCLTTFWSISLHLAFSAINIIFSSDIVSLSGKLTYSEVRAFLKKQPHIMTQCKSIVTVNETINLTGNHLVFARENSDDQFNEM